MRQCLPLQRWLFWCCVCACVSLHIHTFVYDDDDDDDDMCVCVCVCTGPNGGTCEACEVGKYKDSAGPAACSTCPSNSALPAGLCGLFA